ncbi:MAG: QacE family quaternary ammonium compound efflux SMR transporter [Roseibium sp.]|uniref:SMR family transporter n=1 Tax=Roseibium sp. TaxID=1936156 RepID=UPI001B0BE3B2|nr:SMR family transporter [Roseibium sp.]MBO6508871.1 QacE family quaternary ammonium compound efflux SMR transporter [Roseibium sp.]MBO6890505.1 QacE family quaternary ammonium compound efflux SMR transporter [Roseibium sp.]MBO6929550.1 QacE family quaternary ammonium compound efflux SMR transporter [Roseibium sp.]
MPASAVTTYLFLGAAIVAEVVATSALARTENFTRLLPTVITVVGYALSFWLLSFPIRVLPTGIVYAIWSGAGIVLITMVAWFLFDQKLDLPALLGLGLIIAGVAIINLFSKSMVH